MVDPIDDVVEGNPRGDHTNSVPAHSVNKNLLVATPQGSQEAVSIPQGLENPGGPCGLLEGLDPELLAKIVAKVTQKLKNADSKADRKGNKHFERVAKQNPKTYDGKEDPIILEEWVRQMEKIFDVVEVPDGKRVSIGAFYLSG